MSVALVSSTVVIAARQFNPSIVRDRWLVNNQLLDPDDLQEGCAFTDAFSNVLSREFNLLVVPGQLQFVPKVEADREQELVSAKVGTIVRNLPHTPYTGIGMNFTWHIRPKEHSTQDLTRKLFFVEDNALCREYNVVDAKFGAYFSRDVLGRRLKLDVKPITLETNRGEIEVLQCAFNFHRGLDAEDDAVTVIIDSLGRWNEARAESEREVNILIGERDQ